MKYTEDQKYHLRAGTLWSVYESLTGQFIIAFVLVLGATNMEVGLLGAMPFIAMLLSQVPGVMMLEYYTRLGLFKVATTISRLLWIPIAIVAMNGTANPILVVSALYFFVKFGETLVDASLPITVVDHPLIDWKLGPATTPP